MNMTNIRRLLRRIWNVLFSASGLNRRQGDNRYLIDTGLVKYFKAKSGQQDYQEFINNALRWAIKPDAR